MKFTERYVPMRRRCFCASAVPTFCGLLLVLKKGPTEPKEMFPSNDSGVLSSLCLRQIRGAHDYGRLSMPHTISRIVNYSMPNIVFINWLMLSSASLAIARVIPSSSVEET